MDDFAIACVVHVIAVLLWIGGVAFVTLVVFPFIRTSHPPVERLEAFHRIEGRFAPQAKVWVLLAGASGLWMVWRADLAVRFAEPHFWWMHAMVAVWLIFALMLFVIEPLFLHRRMARCPNPAQDFVRMAAMHRLLLLVSLIAVAGVGGGSHGLF